MAASNKFCILTNDDIDPIVYDSNGNIDLDAMIPEYKKLNDALKFGVSWYDLMYPGGEMNDSNATTTKEVDEWTNVENKTNKKRNNRTSSPIMSEPTKKRTHLQ